MRVSDHFELDCRQLGAAVWVLQMNLGLLEEQLVFPTAESSLQPLFDPLDRPV